MIQILDCTLRDGGYLNDWDFGEDTINYVVQRHINAGAELVEVGFLDDRRTFDIGRTIQPSLDCYDQQLKNIDKKDALLFAMIDYGTHAIENIPPHRPDSMIDGIRVIFKKPNKEKAVRFAEQIQQLGYLVTLQLVSVTAYQDQDILDFCREVNRINPYAVGIVDTYGLMHEEKLLHYFDILDHNLNPSIGIGYHAHNNFQLAYANCIRFMESKTKRNMIVDATALGMGKNAGNAPMELVMMYLNENYGTNYNVEQVLETIDACILAIYARVEWGYKLRFFLSASNACHPNYVTYLLAKKSMPISQVNEILQSIPHAQKLDYDQKLIEALYAAHQTTQQSGGMQDKQFAEKVTGKTVLLLGPGKSIHEKRDEVLSYIGEEAPIVISVNCIPEFYPLNSVFLSNSKRYSLLHSRLMRLENVEIAVTSNVGVLEAPDYTLDVSRYWGDDAFCNDNALALLLNIMSQAEVKELVLAGFDGFSSPTDESNFYDKHLSMADDYSHLQSINESLKERIRLARQRLSIRFLTPSLYEM